MDIDHPANSTGGSVVTCVARACASLPRHLQMAVVMLAVVSTVMRDAGINEAA